MPAMTIKLQDLSVSEREKIGPLLSLAPNDPLELEEMWQLMDQVWDNLGCDNQDLDSEKIAQYYQHPIWLLNGLFIESHDLSLQHRRAIATWITDHQLQTILDFGGGFGTLARMIADKLPSATIHIYEPYPSQSAVAFCQPYPNIHFASQLTPGYDCLISTDVLEHVPDPLSLFAEMISMVNLQGYLIIANHFYPSIKCHLPCTFHFRYSFNQFAKLMGLRQIGLCVGSHATIYQKIKDDPLDWPAIRKLEKQSQQRFPMREWIARQLSPGKKFLRSLIPSSPEVKP